MHRSARRIKVTRRGHARVCIQTYIVVVHILQALAVRHCPVDHAHAIVVAHKPMAVVDFSAVNTSHSRITLAGVVVDTVSARGIPWTRITCAVVRIDAAAHTTSSCEAVTFHKICAGLVAEPIVVARLIGAVGEQFLAALSANPSWALTECEAAGVDHTPRRTVFTDSWLCSANIAAENSHKRRQQDSPTHIHRNSAQFQSGSFTHSHTRLRNNCYLAVPLGLPVGSA
eukprot:scpid7646/ scgid10656/ 